MPEWKKSIMLNIFSLLIILLLLIPASTSHLYIPWYGREDTVKIGDEQTRSVSNMGLREFWVTNSSGSIDRYFTISFGKPANVTSNSEEFDSPSYGTNASDANYYGEKKTYMKMPYFLAGALLMNLLALLSTLLVGTKKIVKEAGTAVGVVAVIVMLFPVLYFMLTFKGGITGFLYYSDSFNGDDYHYTLLKHPSWGWLLGIFAVAVQGVALRALQRQMTDVKYMKRAIKKESGGPKKQELENGMAGLVLSLMVVLILIVAPYIYLLIPWEYESKESSDGENNITENLGMDTRNLWNVDSQFKSIYLDRNKEHLLRDENGTVQQPSEEHRAVGERVSYILIIGALFTLIAIGAVHSVKNEKVNQRWATRTSIIAGTVILLAPLYFVAGYANINHLSYIDIIYHRESGEAIRLYMNVSYAWFISLSMGMVNIAAGIHMRSRSAKIEKQVKKISTSLGVDPDHLIGKNAVSQESSFTSNMLTTAPQPTQTQQGIPAGFHPVPMPSSLPGQANTPVRQIEPSPPNKGTENGVPHKPQ